MKPVDNPSPKGKSSSGQGAWTWILIALPVLVLLVGSLPYWRGWIARVIPPNTNQPYQYPYAQSLPGTQNPKLKLQNEIAFYQDRIRRDPEGGLDLALLATAYLKLARATGKGSWYLLAEQAAQRSLANLPMQNEGAIVVLARVAEASHDFQTTLRLTNQVLKVQPGDEGALGVQVTTKLALGKLAEAHQAADTLVKQTPSMGSLTLRALVRVAQGQDQAALQDFRQALDMEEPGEVGTSAWTRTLLGRFYYKRGQLEQARSLYNEALRILPRYPLALLNLAELEIRLQQYRAAEAAYAQVNPFSQDASTVFDHVVLRGRARLKVLQQDAAEASALRDRAEALLRQSLTGHGGAFGHRRELASLLLERQQNPQAIAEALTLMQAEVKVRQDAQTLNLLAWALVQSGQVQQAQQAMQTALKSGIRDPELYYRRGMIEQALGNAQESAKFLQLAKQTDPTFDQQARQSLGLGVGMAGTN